jgi:preprotein translocase subunit YajC
MESLATLLPFALILLVGYLLIVRPQQRRAREIRATQAAVQVGSRVLMGSGLHATVVAIEGDVVTVEPSPGIHLRFARAAVYQVLDAPGTADDSPLDAPAHRPADEQA